MLPQKSWVGLGWGAGGLNSQIIRVWQTKIFACAAIFRIGVKKICQNILKEHYF